MKRACLKWEGPQGSFLRERLIEQVVRFAVRARHRREARTQPITAHIACVPVAMTAIWPV